MNEWQIISLIFHLYDIRTDPGVISERRKKLLKDVISYLCLVNDIYVLMAVGMNMHAHTSG